MFNPYGAQNVHPQTGVQPRAGGYHAPVANYNPFTSLMLAGALSKSTSGSSSGTKVRVVTYESVYGKKFVEEHMGKDLYESPMALKYEGSDVLIPLPTHASIVAKTKQTLDGMKTGTDKTSIDRATKALNVEMFRAHADKCGHGGLKQTSECEPSLAVTSDEALGNPIMGVQPSETI